MGVLPCRTTSILYLAHMQVLSVNVCFCRLAGDQRARRDVRHDSDAEDDDDVKKVKIETVLKNIFVSESDICVVLKSQAF